MPSLCHHSHLGAGRTWRRPRPPGDTSSAWRSAEMSSAEGACPKSMPTGSSTSWKNQIQRVQAAFPDTHPALSPSEHNLALPRTEIWGHQSAPTLRSPHLSRTSYQGCESKRNQSWRSRVWASSVPPRGAGEPLLLNTDFRRAGGCKANKREMISVSLSLRQSRGLGLLHPLNAASRGCAVPRHIREALAPPQGTSAP